jgi:hypothetical protein
MKLQDIPEDIEPQVGDILEIEQGDVCFEVRIIGITADGYLCEQDNVQGAVLLEGVDLDHSDVTDITGYIAEERVRLDPKCWKGKKIGNPKTKMKGGVRVNNCVPEGQEVAEAGPFRSTEPKKPRKGSVADLAARKRAEQDRTPERQREIDAIGNKNHYVGTARVRHDKSDVSEGSDLPPKVIEMIKKIAQSSASPEHKKAAIDALVAKYSKKGVAEGPEDNRQWSKKDNEQFRRAVRDIESNFGPDDAWTKTKQRQIKQQIKTEPMSGPKGKLPEQGVAEGSSYRTDSMVSHISQIITDIYPQGGDKNTYMKLVARAMPSIVKANPKLFRRAFGIAYDRFFHIGQDDDDDDNFDYTDYSMRQGELGNPNRGMREGYTGRETKDGTWRVFKDGKAVAAAGPFKSREEAAAWIKKQKQGVAEGRHFRTAYGYAGGYNEKTGGKYKHPEDIRADREAKKKTKDQEQAEKKPQQAVKEGLAHPDTLKEYSFAEKQTYMNFLAAKAKKYGVQSLKPEERSELMAYLQAQKMTKEQQGVAEGPEEHEYSLSMGNRQRPGSDRLDTDSRNRMDSLRAQEHDLKQRTIDILLKRHPDWEHSDLELAPLRELIDMLRKPATRDMDEAKYQGREVPLGKKMAGDVKKSKVYVRKPNGKVVKVNFGDKDMKIKKSNPARRKSFRARHNCDNPGPRWKARYWSCRSW